MNIQAPALVKYDHMCAAIAEAREVDEVKDIRDKALALAAYARQSKNIEAEVQLAEIRLRAERKAGQLLSEVEKSRGAIGSAGPGRGNKTPSPATTSFSSPKTLAEYGLSRDQSSKFQKLAAVPEEIFEKEVSRRDEVPTTEGIIRAAAPRSTGVVPVSDNALWLWGRLRDFERDGLLDRTPTDVMETMTQSMVDDVIGLAPRVAEWLSSIGDADESE